MVKTCLIRPKIPSSLLIDVQLFGLEMGSFEADLIAAVPPVVKFHGCSRGWSKKAQGKRR
jgi:hypothetical protein